MGQGTVRTVCCTVGVHADSRFNVPIPNPSLTPLSQLIATLSTQTGIPPDALKLIYKGAILKDPSLTLSAYGIEDGSTLALVGSNQPAPSAPAAAPKAAAAKKKNKQPETTSQEVLVDWIRGLVDGALSPLQASIEAFVRNSRDDKQVEGNRPAQKPTFEVLQREHARLSETLLRSLLDLDGVEIPSEWQDARKERKEGVRRVQGELTRVDDAWGTRKRIGQ